MYINYLIWISCIMIATTFLDAGIFAMCTMLVWYDIFFIDR